VKIAAAVLCDAATVREGLANVLGAGVTNIYRDSFPAPLRATLFYLVEIPPEEFAQPRKISIEISSSDVVDGQPLARIEGGWESTGALDEDRLPVYFPVIVGFDQTAIPGPGYYEVRIEMDSGETRILPFKVNLVEATEPEPVEGVDSTP
jgi:hypothetical protein